jgi:hypothetical protein
MLIDFEATDQGSWFQYFVSRFDSAAGKIVYDPPAGDARVKIRSTIPFWEERAAKRKRVAEFALNPTTRAMERISYLKDQTPEELKTEREDAFDYAILEWENFIDRKTKEPIPCTRENKIKASRNIEFSLFLNECLRILAEADGLAKEQEEKN